jgi:hypothetical protein
MLMPPFESTAMPLACVKLPKSIKQRVASMAAVHGSTSHAVMAKAIESAFERARRCTNQPSCMTAQSSRLICEPKRAATRQSSPV